ncbi:MAG TPA: HIT domain-containing protein [Pyrinomonadaceae bacterium]|nr:HIT domain-containing protein [Pyrinomonadaceae bacterium]
MDRLWSPWRSEYIASAGNADASVCVFCKLRDENEHDEQNLVVLRAEHSFIALNRYPYTSGHMLIIPNEHIAEFHEVAKQVTDELMDLAKVAQRVLREVYQADGYNLGMNLGGAAGAGIADHLHLHILPRWSGDTNFMTTVAGARVLPEDLSTTYAKLRRRF